MIEGGRMENEHDMLKMQGTSPAVPGEIKLEENVSVECGLAIFGLGNLARMTWSLPTADTFSFLQPVFETIYTRVIRRNGMIDTFSSDKVAVFFPRVYTEQVNLIVDSAIDASSEVLHWFYRHFQRTGPLSRLPDPVDLSVGIDAGIVSIAHLRSAYHNEVLLLGKQVNLVHRCLDSARSGELLISQEALARAQYKMLYSDYVKPGPDLGEIYHFDHDFYPTVTFDWQNYASRASWIEK